MQPKPRVSYFGKRAPLAERFWRYVEQAPQDACWPWTGYRIRDGYGQISAGVGKKMVLAHRVSYEIHRGPVPGDMCVCHHCDNPPCVNPAHLFLGTVSDNALDRVRKNRGGAPQPARGEAHPDAKLTAEQVRRIRGMEGLRSKRWIAEFFGVAPSTVGDILSGHTWRSEPGVIL